MTGGLGAIVGRAGGHCVRCRAPLSKHIPAIVVLQAFVEELLLDGSFCVYRTERAAVCESCARPVELAIATQSAICEGCEQRLLHRDGSRSPVCCSSRCEQRVRRRERRLIWSSPCDGCGNSFNPQRADARFCSGACRQRAYRQRARSRSTRGPGRRLARAAPHPRHPRGESGREGST